MKLSSNLSLDPSLFKFPTLSRKSLLNIYIFHCSFIDCLNFTTSLKVGQRICFSDFYHPLKVFTHPNLFSLLISSKLWPWRQYRVVVKNMDSGVRLLIFNSTQASHFLISLVTLGKVLNFFRTQTHYPQIKLIIVFYRAVKNIKCGTISSVLCIFTAFSKC